MAWRGERRAEAGEVIEVLTLKVGLRVPDVERRTLAAPTFDQDTSTLSCCAS
jgi:hypothetical protein